MVRRRYPGEPGQGAFDLPALTAQALGRVDAAASDLRRDAALAQEGAQAFDVLALCRLAAWPIGVGGDHAGTSAPGWRGPSVRRPRSRAGLCPRHRSPGQALVIGQDVDLGALLAPVSEPLLARTLAASKMTELQSIIPGRPEPVQDLALHAGEHPGPGAGDEPAVRRGQEDAERVRRHPPRAPAGQYVHDRGDTARAATGAVPPPCGRASNSGSSGSTISHNSSGTSRNADAPLTTPDHAANHHDRNSSPRLGRPRETTSMVRSCCGDAGRGGPPQRLTGSGQGSVQAARR